VPQRGVRIAKKFGITAFLLLFTTMAATNCHFNQIGVSPFLKKDLKGAMNQNKAEKL
jgi:hypothetical protein